MYHAIAPQTAEWTVTFSGRSTSNTVTTNSDRLASSKNVTSVRPGLRRSCPVVRTTRRSASTTKTVCTEAWMNDDTEVATASTPTTTTSASPDSVVNDITADTARKHSSSATAASAAIIRDDSSTIDGRGLSTSVDGTKRSWRNLAAAMTTADVLTASRASWVQYVMKLAYNWCLSDPAELNEFCRTTK